MRSRFQGAPSGLRPCGGLYPTMPQVEAGIRIDPPISVPVARVVNPAASAAPDPPEEPTGPYALFHGFSVVPHIGELQTQETQNSDVVVRAWTIAPAASSLS